MVILKGVQKEIVEYLESIGYSIDYSNDLSIPVARKNGYSTIIVAVYDEGDGILLRSMYLVSDEAKSNRSKYLEFVNHLNNDTNLVTYCIGEYDYDNLMVSYWFPEIFEKEIFDKILEMWEEDTTGLLSRQEEYQNFIIRSL